ncbi:MAG: bifunctional phosphopantothenoylcysteine decarboxylase/phosphopantothenate--cysteine ligase CoaBC [Clostridiales bacterium]|nr:bifunctional phosphopantothenoylcysteine decarboxylase/phosphopantothenate--cysteine ligase CoaBC [Clostridiales bacterium]
MANGINIVIGICGGIAAYKGLELVSALKKLEFNIDVIMTKAATKFVTPLSFQSLSLNPVVVDMFEQPKTWEISHISLAKKADIFVVIPATADIIGKVACGIADDMLTTTIMATKAQVLFAPAMNTKMYENLIVQSNIKKLREYGYHFVEPAVGRLACGDVGKGKLADVDDILDEIGTLIVKKKDFKGSRVLVTAGPTIEPIDPVRYITNRSSGRMGYAIAECARDRGAEVLLITGPVHIKEPRNIDIIHIKTNEDMYSSVMENYKNCDAVIKAAAPADYRPLEYSKQKIKKNKGELVLKLTKNIDILNELGKIKGDKILVGFAAESQNIIENAKEKLEEKNLDFIVANDISSVDTGFNSEYNKACIISRDRTEDLPRMSKRELADKILDNIKRISANK